MYKGEDDDLPIQYSGLTAPLETNSVDLDRRLTAYLSSQVAMRSAMEQMVKNQHNSTRYTDAAQFADQGQYSMSQSPMKNHTMPPTMINPHQFAPCLSPHQPGSRQIHVKPNSIAAPHELLSSRMSQSPIIQNQSQDGRRMPTALLPQSVHPVPIKAEVINSDADYQRAIQSVTVGQYLPMYQDIGSFTKSLPPESQQLLVGIMDLNDPFTSSLMAGSRNSLSNPHYPWGKMQGSDKTGQVNQTMYPSHDSVSTIFAPATLDNGTDNAYASTGTSAPLNDSASTPSSDLDFQLFQETNKKELYCQDSPNLECGQVTLNEGFGILSLMKVIELRSLRRLNN